MIKFTKINEVYTRIDCSTDLLYELVDLYGKYIPNHKYHPLVKARKWNGKIYFINKTTRLFYNGLLKDIWVACKDRGETEFQFVGYDKTKEFTQERIISDVENIILPDEISIYDYQLEAIVEGLTNMRRLLISPTSSGKSLILYIMARLLTNAGYKVLIQVPSVMLVNQMYSDFISYAINDEYDVESNVHKIYAGQSKKSDKNIIISTWQSISTMVVKEKKKVVDDTEMRAFMEQFDVILSDEVHKAESNEVKSIMEAGIYGKYRIGLTGTLNDESKSLPETLTGLFGKVYKVITTKELMDSGRVSKLKIYPMVLNYSEEYKKLISKMDYHDELTTIIGNQNRNKFIVNLAKRLDGNTIILLRHIDKHAKPLVEMLQKSTDKKIILLDKDTKTDDRETIRQSLEDIDDAIIIGTYALISTGVSIKNLKYLIFASPMKSRVACIQAIGRILRLSPNKTLAVLFDIVDNMEYKGKPNYVLDHFRKRFDYYTEEDFDVEIKEFDLKMEE